MTGATDTTMPTSEVIGLFPDPAKLFDGEARLVVANASFSTLLVSIAQFINAGTA